MAMPAHRGGRSTHRDTGICNPRGGFPSPPDALHDACDGAHHGASRAFPVEPETPSYGRHMFDSIHHGRGIL